MESYYSAVDAAKIANITRRQLDYWTEIGLVEPAITAPRGKAGTVKLFNFDGLFQLRILRALLDAGFSIQALRRIAEEDRGSLDAECNLSRFQDYVVSSSREKGAPVKLDMAGIIEVFRQGGFYNNNLLVLSESGLIKIDLKAMCEELEAATIEEASIKK